MQHLTRPFDVEPALTRSLILAAAFAAAAASAAAPMAALGATTALGVPAATGATPAAPVPQVLTYAQTVELDDVGSATANEDVVRVVEDGARSSATFLSAAGSPRPGAAVADQAAQCYRLVSSLAPVAARLAAGEPVPSGRLDVAIDGRATPLDLDLASQPLGDGFTRLVARSRDGATARFAAAIDETNGLVVGASYRIAAERRDGSARVATCRMQLLPTATATVPVPAVVPPLASLGA